MDSLSLNEKLLIWINQDLANPAFDVFFEWISMKAGFSIPLMLLLTLYIGVRFGRSGWILSVMILLVVGFSDLFGSFLKDIFLQPRPCLEFYDQIRSAWGGDTRCETSTSGMPSNHALNFFATFTFISYYFPKAKVMWASLILASLVSFSRIYLGEHFPLQVLAGIFIGFSFGLTLAVISHKYLKRYINLHEV